MAEETWEPQGRMIPPDIFFYASTAFLLGILLASFGWHFYFAVLALTAIFFVTLHFSRATPLLLFLIFFLATGTFGMFYYRLFLNLHEVRGATFGEPVAFQGVVVSEPSLSETTAAFDLRLSPPLKGEVRVVTSRAEFTRYGDLLSFHGILEKRDPPEKPTILFPKTTAVDHSHGNWFKERLIGFKERFFAQFKGFLSEDEAALAAGLTLGARGDFRREFRIQMAASGTTHLVALSGYNIAILVFAIAAALGRWLRRRVVFFVTIVVIVLFVLMVGGEASVIRAAIMGFLVLGVGELGRLYYPRNAIAFTAVLMALADPTVLAFNTGFLLSFVSLLGIVYLEPVLARAFRFDVEGGFLGWRKILTTTLAAQLAVAPILIQKFGSFSLTAFFANTLILPFVPLTMFFGFMFVAFSLLHPVLGLLWGWLVKVLLDYEIEIIKIFSYFRTSLPGIFTSIAFAGVFYVILVALAARYAYAPKKR